VLASSDSGSVHGLGLRSGFFPCQKAMMAVGLWDTASARVFQGPVGASRASMGPHVHGPVCLVMPCPSVATGLSA